MDEDIQLHRSLPLETFRSRRDVIKAYLYAGYPYKTICKMLQRYHNIGISLRTLKRYIKLYGWSRKVRHTPIQDIYATIVELLKGRGKQLGYRSMHKLLQTQYHFTTTNETVRRILLYIDPIGVSNRKRHRLQRRTYVSKGPNHTWHVDGYDKLKRYGIAINGCIDGYSRRIMWLKCAFSNNDPAIVSGYYLDTIKELGFCPEKVRSDCGTENVVLAAIQCQNVGHERGHVYGSSPSNQRIESWWSTFRKSFSQWWIELFEDLCEMELLNTGINIHVECIRFCFMKIMQKELNKVSYLWNCHKIRPSINARCPSGIPDELYFLPPTDAEDCKCEVQVVNTEVHESFVKRPRMCSDSDIEDFLDFICMQNNWEKPTTWLSATDLYIKLVNLDEVKDI